MLLASSPGPIYRGGGGGGGGRKTGPGRHCQGPSAHALAIAKNLGNRMLL